MDFKHAVFTSRSHFMTEPTPTGANNIPSVSYHHEQYMSEQHFKRIIHMGTAKLRRKKRHTYHIHRHRYPVSPPVIDRVHCCWKYCIDYNADTENKYKVKRVSLNVPFSHLLLFLFSFPAHREFLDKHYKKHCQREIIRFNVPHIKFPLITIWSESDIRYKQFLILKKRGYYASLRKKRITNIYIISYTQGYDIICQYARSSLKVNACARHLIY